MKGLSTMLSFTLVIMFTIVASVMISGWLSTLSYEQTETIKNTTSEKLHCQYGALYISSAIFDCGGTCLTGAPYKLNVTIKNTGSIRLDISRAVIQMDDGMSYESQTTTQSLSAGDQSSINFNDILISTNPKMPIETMDTRAAYVSDNNTRMLLHFNEASGTAYDSSSWGNNGTFYNGTFYNSSSGFTSGGKFSRGMNFDGVDDYVNVSDSNSLDIINNLTIEAWINPKPGTNGYIVAKGMSLTDNASYFFTVTNGILYAIFSDNGTSTVEINSGVAVTPDTWTHVAMTYIPGRTTFYINSSIVSTSTSFSGNIYSGNGRLLIGARGNGTNAQALFFNGTIDEVRISNVARSFTTNLTVNVTRGNINYVKIYNSTNTLLNQTANLGGVASYNATYTGMNTTTEYRAYAEYTNGNTHSKWHPTGADQTCKTTSNIEKLLVSSDNCPLSSQDALPGGDVTFVSCV